MKNNLINIYNQNSRYHHTCLFLQLIEMRELTCFLFIKKIANIFEIYKNNVTFLILTATDKKMAILF